MITPVSGFSEVPHTADVALRVWAPDYCGLLVQAAAGMYSIMGDVVIVPGRQVTRDLHLKAEDRESLLVTFLTELLFLFERENLVFDVRDVVYEDFKIDCKLAEMHLQSIQRAIKAVTYHNLSIKEVENRVETVIVLDV